MMPVRNEAWVLPHSLACLSGFADVILVSDRGSEDGSREIYRRFPRVVALDAAFDHRIRQQRWQLLDAARDYAGQNLLWSCDADELVSPGLMTRFLDGARERLQSGAVVEARLYTLWHGATRYRSGQTSYAPHWKRLGFVDDRRADYDRSSPTALHEPRIPAPPAEPGLRAEDPRVLHLQYAVPARNQMKQAWYRCREWLDGGKTAAAINEFYAITLPERRARTAPVPPEWVADVTVPDLAADREPTWHEADIRRWFDRHGAERFEPLEIWHVEALAREFRRRVGRRPRPERSYRRPWPARLGAGARRALGAARRRLRS